MSRVVEAIEPPVVVTRRVPRSPPDQRRTPTLREDRLVPVLLVASILADPAAATSERAASIAPVTLSSRSGASCVPQDTRPAIVRQTVACRTHVLPFIHSPAETQVDPAR